MGKTSVLLVLSQDLLDRARVLVGHATSALMLPVSLRIVLGALIEEGLTRRDRRALLANVKAQAIAVHDMRRGGRRGRRTRDGNRAHDES